MLASPVMNHRAAQLVSLLLIALASGLCAPDRSSAETPAPPGIVSDEARVTPACDIATNDDPSLPKSKTGVVAAGASAVAVAPVDAPPAAAAAPLPLAALHQIALEGLASRAPPLV